MVIKLHCNYLGAALHIQQQKLYIIYSGQLLQLTNSICKNKDFLTKDSFIELMNNLYKQF